MPLPSEVPPLLDLALRAAQAAAAVIRRAAADPASVQVRAKHPNDFVTQVDVAAERVVVDTLLAACPDHAVRGEESAEPHGNPAADHVWIVDPIDGTHNFIHGYPAYAVSLALAVRGTVALGVVWDAARDEVFHAVRGQGAWCGTQRLAVGTRGALIDALVTTNSPFGPGPGLADGLRTLGGVVGAVSALRRGGSAALDLAWVAAGRCDAMYDRGLKAWDVAAGGLLVAEAGGVVSTFDGHPDYLEARECVAANPVLHAALSALLRQTAPSPARH